MSLPPCLSSPHFTEMSIPLLTFPECHSRLPGRATQHNCFWDSPSGTLNPQILSARPTISLLSCPGVSTGKKEILGCLNLCPGHKGQECLCSLACWGPGQERGPGHLPAPENPATRAHHAVKRRLPGQRPPELQLRSVPAPSQPSVLCRVRCLLGELTADPGLASCG